VSFHGIALNVTTNLADFELIDPCGMPGLRSTSIARERARAGLAGADPEAPPSTESVAEAAAAFAPALARRLGLELAGDLATVRHGEVAGALQVAGGPVGGHG
jgi:lipoate-protein ligase B